MAFQYPVARPSRRAAAPPLIETSVNTPRRPDPEPVSDSQEWVVFSPDPRKSDARSASESLLTPRTAAKSRLSDFGSLDTGAQSERDARAEDDRPQVEDDDDNEDLDSLDDGLHAFNEPATLSSIRAVDPAALGSSADAILPAHDGLGAFPGSSSPVQEQFWRHERNNPRRRRQSLRRPSLQKRIDVLDDHEEQQQQQQTIKDERFQRIEKWRMDQSRAIMEEIERESHRLRRRSRLSAASSTAEPSLAVGEDEQEQEQEPIEPEARQPAEVESSAEPVVESFWTRLTRHVMRDLMGFDHATLHYIFGEDVPTTAALSREAEMMQEAERVARQEEEEGKRSAEESGIWEERLLARIARELGTFVHQVSEHPGAFGSYLKTRDDVPYAGLPTPPELSSEGSHRRHSSSGRHRRRVSVAKTDPSLFGIEEEAEDVDLTPQVSRQQEAYELSLQREREYWERDVDVKMVFGYLRKRLSRSPPSSSPPPASASLFPAPGSPRQATASSNPSDSLRRAALIRHHHPLVSKNKAPSESVAMPLSPILGRRPSSLIEDDAASSCASQSTKKSKTRHSGSISLGSSRNYWDIGGPAWGEV